MLTSHAHAALDVDWILNMAKTEATVKVNTDVVFKWGGYHDVYLLPSKADYDSCNFANGNLLAPTSQNSYTYKASSPGTFYFSCSIGNGYHCNTPQKLALTVTGTLSAWVNCGKP